jgi:hypothetical protein
VIASDDLTTYKPVVEELSGVKSGIRPCEGSKVRQEC